MTLSYEQTLAALDAGAVALPGRRGDLLALHGTDTLDLLQRICASELRDLDAGGCRSLVFTDDKGRVIDIPLLVLRESTIHLVASPTRGAALAEWIGKWIIMEDVSVEPDPSTFWALHGPASPPPGVVEEEGGWSAAAEGLLGAPTWVVGDRAPAAIGDADAVTAWHLDRAEWLPGASLAHPANPHELGLRDLVSFTKGCYIGQEVVARLDTYDKVQRRLAILEGSVPEGTTLQHEGRKCGVVIEASRERVFALVSRGVESGASVRARETETPMQVV